MPGLLSFNFLTSDITDGSLTQEEAEAQIAATGNFLVSGANQHGPVIVTAGEAEALANWPSTNDIYAMGYFAEPAIYDWTDWTDEPKTEEPPKKIAEMDQIEMTRFYVESGMEGKAKSLQEAFDDYIQKKGAFDAHNKKYNGILDAINKHEEAKKNYHEGTADYNDIHLAILDLENDQKLLDELSQKIAKTYADANTGYNKLVKNLVNHEERLAEHNQENDVSDDQLKANLARVKMSGASKTTGLGTGDIDIVGLDYSTKTFLVDVDSPFYDIQDDENAQNAIEAVEKQFEDVGKKFTTKHFGAVKYGDSYRVIYVADDGESYSVGYNPTNGDISSTTWRKTKDEDWSDDDVDDDSWPADYIKITNLIKKSKPTVVATAK